MKKGITFMTIISAVIIMIIFISTVTISSMSILNNSNKTKFATEIAYIQEAVNNYLDKYNEYPILSSINVDLDNVEENDLEQFNDEDKTGDNIVVLYVLDFNKLGNIERIYGKGNTSDKNIYALSKTTGKVYYLKGVNVGSTTYFTLTDDLKKIINYVPTNNNSVTKDGISFIPSTLNWTADIITTRIVVSDKYTDNGKEVDVSVRYSSNGEKKYTITKDSNNECIVDDIIGNYSIKVKYGDGNSQTQTFSITNFDNVPPSFEVSDRIDLISREEGTHYSYVEVKNVADDLSGIKSIKYERENISDTNKNDDFDEIATYFKTNGIELNGDIIEFDQSTKYITIYVEDNAGNYKCITKNVWKEE